MHVLLMTAIAAVALGADQALKAAVAARLPLGRGVAYHGIALTHQRNHRARLVMAPPWRLAGEWVLFAMTLLSLRHAAPAAPSTLVEAAVGLLLGGTAGNAIDLWRHQAIVDVVDLGWWPVFNLADAAIVSGVLLGLLAAGRGA
jgi:signal peptidase II